MPKRTDFTEGKTAIKFIQRVKMPANKYMQFYKKNGGLDDDSVSYACFYSRVRTGWDWNEAIKKKKNKYKITIKKQAPKEKPKEEKTYIDVKYNSEEARIFKESFERIINSLEEQYEMEENPADAKLIKEKIDEAKKEYEIFLHHNL